MKSFYNISQGQQIERWGNVLRVLQALTPHQRRKHWDMGGFGRKTDCGTIACAAGHAGLDPWFRRRGFKLAFNRFGDSVIDDVDKFFGYAGSQHIFYNYRTRPVSKVISEVKAHIKELKVAPEEFDPYF